MTFQIPKSLKLEHEELHAELVKATKAGGKTGEAAKAVAEVLHSHFVKEEEFALPPIGLLSLLAHGKIDKEMQSVLPMTDRLKAELPEMLREHAAVVAALEKLIVAAKNENLPEHARFAEKLILHAQTEEEVLYPAAILVGEYLKTKFDTCMSGKIYRYLAHDHERLDALLDQAMLDPTTSTRRLTRNFVRVC
jgi:hypothetical protein